MSIWSRVTKDGHLEPLTATEDKRARQRFAALMNERAVHIGARRNDGTGIQVIGTVTELHGPTEEGGVCRCCFGRRSYAQESLEGEGA